MKRKLIGLAAIVMALGMVGCGGEKKVEPCEEHVWGDAYVLDGETGHHRVCTVCGEAEESQNHSWKQDSSKTNKAATCVAAGVNYKVCKCGKTKEEAVAQLTTHTWVDAADQSGLNPASCTAGGQTRKVCSVQGCTVAPKIETSATALGHNYQVQGTATGGVSNEKCSRCTSEVIVLDIASATGWNKATTKWNAKTTEASNNAVEACWDVTGKIPNGTYMIEVEGKMSYPSHSNRKWYNMAKAELCVDATVEENASDNPDKTTEANFRYFFSYNDGAPINPDTKKSWGDLGYDAENPTYGLAVSTCTITNATKFSAWHGDIGYSMVVSKIRLTKIA